MFFSHRSTLPTSHGSKNTKILWAFIHKRKISEIIKFGILTYWTYCHNHEGSAFSIATFLGWPGIYPSLVSLMANKSRKYTRKLCIYNSYVLKNKTKKLAVSVWGFLNEKMSPLYHRRLNTTQLVLPEGNKRGRTQPKRSSSPHQTCQWDPLALRYLSFIWVSKCVIFDFFEFTTKVRMRNW